MKRILGQYKGFNSSIYALFVAMLVTNMGSFIWPLLTFILADKMGYNETTIGTMTFLIGLLALPISFIGGKLADRFDKKKLIIVFDIVTFLSYLICSFMEPSLGMVIFLVIAALFAIMELPAFSALIIDITPPKQRERGYSLLYLGRNLGLLFAGAIGGLLYANYLSLAFLLDGISTIFSTALIFIFVKTNIDYSMSEYSVGHYEGKIDANESSLNIIMKYKTIAIYLFICFVSSIVYSQWSFTLPLYLNELFGASTGGARFFGILSSVNGFIVIVATPVLTYVFRKHMQYYKIILGIFIYSFSFLLLINAGKIMIVIMLVLFTIGEVTHTIGSKPYLSGRIPASHRGRLSSYEQVGYALGYAFSNLIAGYLITNFGYTKHFIILFFIGVTICVVSYINFIYDKKTFPKLYER